MTNYEIRKITNEETMKEVQVSGITLSLTFYSGGDIIGIETSPNLTQQQENMLMTTLKSRGYKIIWKDGVML